MTRNDEIAKLAKALVASLAAKGKAVAAAESCTGGWIAKSLTDVAGSSAVFGFGMVSYSNGAKEHLLDVKRDTLEQHGAVSEEVVREMAEGALSLSGADVAVAVSGIAGPDGGCEEKPVGTVWFAWASRDGSSIMIATDLQHFSGDREAVRAQTVLHALEGVQNNVEE
jgi:nicotinamide-nucleotide amidase